MQEIWTNTDAFLAGLLVPESKLDPLAATFMSHARFGLPEISVSPLHGKFLQTLVRGTRATRVLEIGTLAGYSTLYLAQGIGLPSLRSLQQQPIELSALPFIVTLELEEKHAIVARENLARAGLGPREVQVRVGTAFESLQQLIQEGQVFDFVFIDADKQNYSAYFDQCLKLSKVGTMIVSDNVVREGKIVDASNSDEMVNGAQQFLDHISKCKHADSSVLQTVGCRGHDGFAFSIVTSLPL